MSKSKLIKLDGSTTDIILDKVLFDGELKKQAIFDSVLAENASMRQGTHSTKTKAEVSGGGRKPWKQKHTGKARQGSTRNPHWVGGGVAFGPKPNRNYTLKVNRKVNKQALHSAFISKKNDTLMLENIKPMDKPNLKNVINIFSMNSLESNKTLVVLDSFDENFIKSCQNLKNVNIKMWNQISTRDILNNKNILIEENAISKIKEAIL